jgi:exonuclease SbcC
VRVERLDLVAFGPFRDRRIELAPGLTVIYGPNEAGKSSLHAALATALCGVRRARGKTRDEQLFEERYRPWSGGETWKVRALVRLESGRRVEIVQDLGEKSDCRAFDADLGRDISSEIQTQDWTPDATRWLGIDRRAFLAVANVRQADLLALRRDAEALREFVQRAVATAGTDATAAAAIDRIDAFLTEHVGSRSASHGARPFREALRRLEAARTAYDSARAEHDAYLRLMAREEDSAVRARHAGIAVRVATARSVAKDVDSRRRELQHVRELERRFPGGAPRGLVADEALAREAVAAVHVWATRPAAVVLDGPTADDLRREIAATQPRWAPGLDPFAPERGVAPHVAVATAAMPQPAPRPAPQWLGDHEPAAEVLAAATHYEAALGAFRAHAAHRPDATNTPPGGRASLAELQNLAQQLEIPQPVPDPALEMRQTELEVRIAAGNPRAALAVRFALGFTVVVITCAAVFAANGHSPWLMGAAVSTVAALVSLGVGLNSGGVRRAWIEELDHVHGQMAAARRRMERWSAAEEAARECALDLGLVPEADALRRVATERARWEDGRGRKGEWDRVHIELQRECELREDALRVELRDRGVPPGASLLEDVETYKQASKSLGRRRELEAVLERRLRDEAGVARVEQERRASQDVVRSVARQCGLADSDPETSARALQQWLEDRSRAFAEREQAERDWAELRSALAGRTVADLESEHAAAAATAATLAQGLDLNSFSAPNGDLDDVALWQRTQADAERDLAVVRTEIALHAQRTIPVADAEDELRAAENELQRVSDLDDTLRATQEFLSLAQERVHRDVAPMLAARVRAGLAHLTGGRWVDARVDPETLDVQLQDTSGTWRRAALLSHGTAEQVYLLLRAALARHLVRADEACPLFLDDVTVQFDRTRKQAALGLLQAIAQERQVVVFTQEDAVFEWAQAHLVPPADGVVVLDPAPVG